MWKTKKNERSCKCSPTAASFEGNMDYGNPWPTGKILPPQIGSIWIIHLKDKALVLNSHWLPVKSLKLVNIEDAPLACFAKVTLLPRQEDKCAISKRGNALFIFFQLESKVQLQFHVHEAEKLYIQEVLKYIFNRSAYNYVVWPASNSIVVVKWSSSEKSFDR